MYGILTIWDYVIICASMSLAAGIGVFFSIKQRRKQSSSEYFLGNRNMSVVPVAMSLAATVMSAITYFGTPAEAYVHGPKYGFMFITRALVPLVIVNTFLPVFYRLKVTSVYEYLGMRFNNTLRYFVIGAEFVYGLTYMGIVVYVPALAFNTVTGVNLSFSIVTIGIVCTFYTAIGGIRAVIWTDVYQTITMLVGAFVMIIAGSAGTGGPSEGWRRALEGGRGDLLDLNPDPTVRLTFWSIMIGGSSFFIMFCGTKQSLVQRYNSCSSERDAKLAAWLGIIGMGVIELLAVTTGMTVYGYYNTCDPIKAGNIERADQIVPYFIMDMFQSFPGLPGFLISAAFNASLSSMSSILNGMAAVAGEDIIREIWPNITEERYSISVKIVSAIFGVTTIALAFLASALGDVLETALSIGGLFGGPILGVFSLGIFIPRGTSNGAITGMAFGVSLGLFLYIGAQIYPPFIDPPPMLIEGCDVFGATIAESAFHPIRPPLASIFELSYLYLTTVTWMASLWIGTFVSYITTWNTPQVADPKLLAPIVARMIIKTGRENEVNLPTTSEQGVSITTPCSEEVQMKDA